MLATSNIQKHFTQSFGLIYEHCFVTIVLGLRYPKMTMVINILIDGHEWKKKEKAFFRKPTCITVNSPEVLFSKKDDCNIKSQVRQKPSQKCQK